MRYAVGAEDRLIEAAEERIQTITLRQSEAQPTWDGVCGLVKVCDEERDSYGTHDIMEWVANAGGGSPSISERGHSQDAKAPATPPGPSSFRTPSTGIEPGAPPSTSTNGGPAYHSSQIIPHLLRHLSTYQGQLLGSRESRGSGRAAREAQSKLAEVADAAFRSGVVSATQGDVPGAIMLLQIAREACPSSRAKALAKIDKLLVKLEQQEREAPLPPTGSQLPSY